MAIDQNTNHDKQNDQTARNAEAAKANINRTAEQGKQFADAAREGLNKMADLREQATENTKQVVQKSVETARSRPVRPQIASPARSASLVKTASAWPASPSRTWKPSRAAARF